MTSTVRHYEDKLLEYAYGELPAVEHTAVAAHVRSCTQCSAALDDLQRVRQVMRELPQEEAPAAGLDSLLQYAEQAAKRSAESKRPKLWTRIIMIASSCAALVTVGIVALRAEREFQPVANAVSQKLAEEKPAAPPAPSAAFGAPEEESMAEQVAKAGDKDDEGDAVAKLALSEKNLSAGKEARGYGPSGGLGGLGTKGTGSSLGDDLGRVRKAEAPAKTESPKAKRRALDDERYDAVGNALADSSARREQKAELIESQEEAPGTRDEGAASAPTASGGGVAIDQRMEAPPPPARAKPEPSVVAKYDAPAARAPAPSPKDAPVAQPAPAPAAPPAEASAAYEPERSKAVAKKQAPSNASLKARLADALALLPKTTGAARAQTLSEICSLWEALGDARQADSYCDRLLQEFPNSSEARALTMRREGRQVAPATTGQGL